MTRSSLILSIVCATSLAFAAETPNEEPYQTVVKVNKSKETLLESTRSIENKNSEDLLEEQPSSLPDALRQSAGVHLQETNRGSGAPIIRGFIGPQNGIRIDGIRFNTSTFRTGPNQYLALNSPYALSRVEILRGPSSVLYGNGAMGGIIQLFTTDFTQSELRKIAVSHQSADNGGGVHALFSEDLGNLSYVGSIGGQLHGILRSGANNYQAHSSYEKGNWLGKARYQINDTWDITTAYLGTTLQNAGRTDKLGSGDIRFYSNDDHLAYIRSHHRFNGVLKEIEATLFFHRLDETVHRYSCSTTTLNDTTTVSNLSGCVELDKGEVTKERIYEDNVDSAGGQLDSRWSFASGRLQLLAGAEAHYDQVGSRLEQAEEANAFEWQKQQRGNFSNDSSFLSTALFLNTRANILEVGSKGRIRASAGVRFSSFTANAPNVPNLGDVSYSFSGLVADASLQWIQNDQSNVYISFNQGFRAPNLQETTVLGDTGSKFEIPNDKLKPESADSFELGIRLRQPWLKLHAALFYTILENTITESDTTYNGSETFEGNRVVQRTNAGSGLIRGIEASAQIPLAHFSFDLTGTLLEAKIKDQDGTTTPMRRSPPFSTTAGLRYRFPSDRGSIRLYGQYAARADQLHPSDEKDLRICETSQHSGLLKESCNGTKSWATLNLSTTWKLNSTLETRLALLNLTDENYRLHGSGFDRPGFNARVMLEGQF